MSNKVPAVWDLASNDITVPPLVNPLPAPVLIRIPVPLDSASIENCATVPVLTESAETRTKPSGVTFGDVELMCIKWPVVMPLPPVRFTADPVLN
jgi:hypothetical protein